jgi:hypothetical protein
MAETGQGVFLQISKKGGKIPQCGVVGGMKFQYMFMLASKQVIGASAKIGLACFFG